MERCAKERRALDCTGQAVVYRFGYARLGMTGIGSHGLSGSVYVWNGRARKEVKYDVEAD